MANTEEIEKDIHNYSALESFRLSEAGNILIKGYVEDILRKMDTLANGYRTMSHVELMGHCAEMAEKLDFVRVLTLAKGQNDLAKQALKEALEEPDG